MRVNVVFLVLVFGVLGVPSTSWAEKVRTNAKAKVYNRAGEQGKVVAKLKQGQAMTVLAKDGRWLKVRVSGRTGWIPRSKVDMPRDDDEIVRNTRRRAFVDGRSTKRAVGGEAPDDRIGADATETGGDEGGDDGGDEGGDDGGDEGGDDGGDDGEKKKKNKSGGDDDEDSIESSGGNDEDEPADDGNDENDEEIEDTRPKARVSEKATVYNEADKGSGKAFTASPSEVLFIESKKGKWTEVSIEEGDIGWIQSSKLEIDEDDDDGGGRRKRGRVIDMRARLGFTLVSQTLTSTGGGVVWPDRYKIGSSSLAVALGGALLYPYKKDYYLGGEVTYDIAKAFPGIAFDPDGANGPMPSSTTSFTMHNLNVRAVAAYDFKKKSGLWAIGKLGYHYESFLVADVENLTKNSARLPSEIIQGPSLGFTLWMPRLAKSIGVRANLDAVLIGASVTQTKNLEDGASPTARRIRAGAALTYKWKPQVDLNFAYDLNYASLTFGSPLTNSMRMHAGSAVQRTDLNHTVSAGIEKIF